MRRKESDRVPWCRSDPCHPHPALLHPSSNFPSLLLNLPGLPSHGTPSTHSQTSHPTPFPAFSGKDCCVHGQPETFSFPAASLESVSYLHPPFLDPALALASPSAVLPFSLPIPRVSEELAQARASLLWDGGRVDQEEKLGRGGFPVLPSSDSEQGQEAHRGPQYIRALLRLGSGASLCLSQWNGPWESWIYLYPWWLLSHCRRPGLALLLGSLPFLEQE